MPVLTARGSIKADGFNLDVGANACADVVDWNNDGKKDLVIGIEDFKVILYLNTGTNNAPIFGSYSTIIYNSSTLFRCSPGVLDFNFDGKKDLVVGEEYGFVYFYENIGTDASPRFSDTGVHVRLNNSASLSVPSSRAHIDLVDWDEDGVQDIIAGNHNGGLYFFKGEQTDVDDPENPHLPGEFSLEPGYPNPFNAQITLRYHIPKASQVQIQIFNLRGEMIRRLAHTHRQPGSYTLHWDGRDDFQSTVSSGIYLVVMRAGDTLHSQKITMIK